MIQPRIDMVPEIDNGVVYKYEYFRLYASTDSIVPRINNAVVIRSSSGISKC